MRPWGLLRSLLAAQFDVADTDSAEVAHRKVVEGLSPWFDERGERQAQLIGQLSGLDFGDSPHLRGLDPRSLRDQAFAALLAYLQALAAKAPHALPALQRAAFVRANEMSDFEGTTERQFDHHLLHQVTYDTLLKAERRLGHGAAARWLTARTKGRGAEFLAMTGEHAERTGETALAIDCFDNAGAEAKRRFANTAAVSWLRRRLALPGESSSARRLRCLACTQDAGLPAAFRAARGEPNHHLGVHGTLGALVEKDEKAAVGQGVFRQWQAIVRALVAVRLGSAQARGNTTHVADMPAR